MPMDLDEEMRLDEKLDMRHGVFISYNRAQKDFGEQLCADIMSRGLHVVDAVKECRVSLIILSEEYLLSKQLMLEWAAIVRSKKREMRIIPVFLGVSREQCYSIPSRWLAVWQDWAKSDSRIDVQEWWRALEEISSTNGFYFGGNREVRYRQIIVDAVRSMLPQDFLGDFASLLLTPTFERMISIQNIRDSMEEFRSQVVICSTQSEFLITQVQDLSSKILAATSLVLKDINWANSQSFDVGRYLAIVSAVLDRFISNVVAAEDLLYLCAEVDWKLAALSVFLPASSDSSHSKFALVARDLEWTVNVYLFLMEISIADRFASISRALSAASNQDRSIVLHKLESGPSKGSVHWEKYDSLLRKRFQEDASPSTPGLVPDCFWIPGRLKFTYVGCVGSGSFKSVLKCQWLGLDVAIAVYKGENAKKDLEAEAGILASVQHPNVVNLFGCAYDDKQEAGYLVTELMEQDLRQLIRERKAARGHGQMPFSLSVSRDIILQIVEAMIHMHKCRVLHRDLKPANCVVSAMKRIVQNDGGYTYYVVKLIDFGSAKVRGPDASTCHTRKQGTTAYMAPELHAMPDDCAYKWSADVYSFGMSIYEILSGKSPFEGVYSGGELVRRVCAGERPLFPECIPVVWKMLIEKCWHRDPEQRPSFECLREDIIVSSWEGYFEQQLRSVGIIFGTTTKSLEE